MVRPSVNARPSNEGLIVGWLLVFEPSSSLGAMPRRPANSGGFHPETRIDGALAALAHRSNHTPRFPIAIRNGGEPEDRMTRKWDWGRCPKPCALQNFEFCGPSNNADSKDFLEVSWVVEDKQPHQKPAFGQMPHCSRCSPFQNKCVGW